MEQVMKAIAAEEKRLHDLPAIIANLKQQRQNLAYEAIRLHRSMPEIPGSADDHQRSLYSAN